MSYRFQQVREILDAALALPLAERYSFALGACKDDPDLWQQVSRLLDAPTDRIDDLVANLLPDAMAEAADLESSQPQVNDRVGPFRLIREIGRGASGVVFLGRQTDPISRDVAVKILRVRPGREAFLRRFEGEQKVLAHLKHPNLAALFDAGTTGDHHPWFAMELVEGVPITDYVQDQDLGLHQRLELFQQVCPGVAYAHRKGVLHRDLKPSNILVTDSAEGPRVKIIDFGIARVLDEADIELSLLTMDGETLGTPQYMSPEQARGESGGVDVRSDVYSLGVVLHEVLTGYPVHDDETDSLYQLIRKVADGEIHVRNHLWDRTDIPGDLRAILSVCLDPDPERRYPGASTLADDLERFLDDRPINARPPSTMYQLRLAIRRHRVVSGLAGAILVLLAGFAITMSVMYADQQKAHQAAQLETEKAQGVSNFLVELLRSTRSDAQGPNVTVREALDEGRARVETDLQGHPEVQIAVYEAIASAYLSIEEFESAEISLQAGLELQKKYDLQPNLAVSLLDELVTLYYYMARYPEATEVAAQVLESRQSSDPHQRDLGPSLNNYGRLLLHEWRFAEAESVIRQAVRHYEENGYTDWGSNYMVAVGNLGIILKDVGKYHQAAEHHPWEIRMRVDKLGPENPWTIGSIMGYAETLTFLGRYTEADSLLRIVEPFVSPEDVNQSADYATLQGVLALDAGRFREALTFMERALRIRSDSLGESSSRLSPFLLQLAGVHAELGEYDVAEKQCRRAVEMVEGANGPDHPEVSVPLIALGAVLARTGSLAEAETTLLRVLEIYERRGITDHWRVVEARFWYGYSLALLGRWDEARPEFLMFCAERSPIPRGIASRMTTLALDVSRQQGDESLTAALLAGSR